MKVCDWKQKVANMVPEQKEYDKFGRSTKLLIHPRDILDLQFNRNKGNKGEISSDTEILTIEVNTTSGRDEHGEILPNQQVSKVISNLSSDREKSVDHSDLSEKRGEFSPKARNCTQSQMNNVSKQYIADPGEESINQGISSSREIVDKGNSNTWFCSPMDCVRKWSKALKQGVTISMGSEKIHTGSTAAGESEKPEFSFFL